MASSDPSSTDFGELIPARMINEYVYCPRLFYLEWVQGEWADSEDTIGGKIIHSRVDTESGQLPEPGDLDTEQRIAARSVTLASTRLGLVAKIDLVEGDGSLVRPVDYKKGSPGQKGAWESDQIQLCVQGLILRDNGYQCDSGILYYAGSKQRIEVVFHEELVDRTLEAVKQAKKVAVLPIPPPPLVDSPKCPRCSLVGICLPDEVSLMRGERLEEIRRLVPARDDAAPVYVLDQGASVGKSGERLVIRPRGGEERSLRFLDVSQVSLYGNVQISAQAIRGLVERGIPIFHHTYGGWLCAVTSGPTSGNVGLRSQQYRVAETEELALPIARGIVVGKVRNQRTLLRRNYRQEAPVDGALRELMRFARLAQSARSREKLFGIEGMAAKTYFAFFSGMLRDPLGFDDAGRKRRPAPDPVNATLSFLYSLLVKEAVRALTVVGLDPYQGIYHRLRFGRPSLALDLVEEFRPLLGDSIALTLFNNRVLSNRSFIRRGGTCALKEDARRSVIEAYEKRMDTLVRHPLFGYKVSYRRVMEIQARLLARCIAGELQFYKPFTTR
ncbi:MAG: CRISPR-associated protein Cas1 [Acidimicrobiia bacterium]